jgi:hypothetical protein
MGTPQKLSGKTGAHAGASPPAVCSISSRPGVALLAPARRRDALSCWVWLSASLRAAASPSGGEQERRLS